MFEISLSQTGLEDVFAMLKRVETFCADPITPVKEELTQWFRDVEARTFTSQGASGRSGSWPGLDPRYAAQKARRYPGRTILERTGRLRASLQVETSDSIVESSVGRLVLGTRVPYARYHQRGDGVPRRAPIDVTNRDAAQAMAIVRRRLEANIRKGAGANRSFPVASGVFV